jgi:signal transduction histidine kinase
MSKPFLSDDESNAEMEEFASVAAHDLKAPLRALENLSHWIREDLGDQAKPELLENLALMNSRIKRMNLLLDGFLAYAKAGLEPDLAVTVDLNKLAKEAAGTPPPRKNLSMIIAPDLPVFQASAAPLRQVLVELVSNALKHHDKAEGSIRIAARDLGKSVEISVQDDGPGIDPKDHKRIFKLGQTLRPKDEVEGNGIGLALVKKILRHHGASLRIESSLGKGSLFQVTWPKAG